MLYIGKGGTDNLECWYLLTSPCVSICSCFIALGVSEIRNNFFIVPINRPPLSDEFPLSMARFAINACQSTPTAVSASGDLIQFDRGRYPYTYLFCKGMAVNAWSYVLSIRQVHAGKSNPSTAHYWQLTPRMDYILLSTPATDRLILLVLAFRLCTGLHHCKRTTTFLKYPKY
eukprot:1812747-Pleurochrysis_carterae.AAC.1